MTATAGTPRRVLMLSTALVSGAFLLAACAGGAPSDSVAKEGANTKDTAGQAGEAAQVAGDVVYQFDEALVTDSSDEIPFVTNETSVVIKLSDGLKKALPDGARMNVEQYVLTTKAYSTGSCRVDMSIDYTDGGLETLSKPREDAGSGDAYRYVGAAITRGNWADHIVDRLPSDDEIDGSGAVMTKDFREYMEIDECSDAPDDAFIKLVFPYVTAEGRLSEYALAEVAVMSNVGNSGENLVTTAIFGESQASVSPTGSWVKSKY